MAPTPSPVLPIVLIVVVLVATGGVLGFLYERSLPHTTSGPSPVRLGDNVTVNYIGVFGSGPEQGKVFDTSLYTVANDPVGYPKSLEFHPHGSSPANFTPLAVHVGGNTPQAGYSLGGLSFIQVVTGFWQGLVGAAPNQTVAIVVPPALGYGSVNPSCLRTLPLVTSMPVVSTVPGTTFTKLFPGALVATGAELTDPHYGWPVLILSANASYVTYENLPPAGWSASPAGWPVTVTGISTAANGSSSITLTNQLFPSQAGLLVGKDYLGNGPCSSSSGGKFIVSSVDLGAGTYTENFNSEVQGQTLIFLVTVVDVFP